MSQMPAGGAGWIIQWHRSQKDLAPALFARFPPTLTLKTYNER